MKNTGSVNGRQFMFPAEPMLYRFDKITAQCKNAHCGPDNVCRCTFYEFVKKGGAYQIVLSNVGDGKGWSHPIHLHGNHFYVIKMGFGKYGSPQSSWKRRMTPDALVYQHQTCVITNFGNLNLG